VRTLAACRDYQNSSGHSPLMQRARCDERAFCVCGAGVRHQWFVLKIHSKILDLLANRMPHSDAMRLCLVVRACNISLRRLSLLGAHILSPGRLCKSLTPRKRPQGSPQALDAFTLIVQLGRTFNDNQYKARTASPCGPRGEFGRVVANVPILLSAAPTLRAS
jgi:hypothetical protein